ncbi:MAG: hypothetical protein ACFFBD_05345, partial [Candidatus Hodarchaeota archaeon]
KIKTFDLKCMYIRPAVVLALRSQTYFLLIVVGNIINPLSVLNIFLRENYRSGNSNIPKTFIGMPVKLLII